MLVIAVEVVPEHGGGTVRMHVSGWTDEGRLRAMLREMKAQVPLRHMYVERGGAFMHMPLAWLMP